MSEALVTDLYELNMAASYLRRSMTEPATFSLFVRDLPPDRGFLVAAGLEDCLRHLEAFRFSEPELDWLLDAGFTAADVGAFRELRFTGEVWAVPEGTVVHPAEPILEVSAPIAEAQLMETLLLNQVTYQTAIATKAARCRLAAPGIELVDFALRRTHGVEAGMAVARLSAIAGFAATSNVAAARHFGLQPAGTMAPASSVRAHPSTPPGSGPVWASVPTCRRSIRPTSSSPTAIVRFSSSRPERPRCRGRSRSGARLPEKTYWGYALSPVRTTPGRCCGRSCLEVGAWGRPSRYRRYGPACGANSTSSRQRRGISCRPRLRRCGCPTSCRPWPNGSERSTWVPDRIERLCRQDDLV